MSKIMLNILKAMQKEIILVCSSVVELT